jgi:hypothetical protein
LAWSSAPRHLGSRDHFIGWSAEARRRHIRFLAYNRRFLILPWVQVEQAQSLRLSNSAACMLEHGYMFLKYVLSQGLGELAAGNDSRNEAQSNALLRTTLRLLPCYLL